jgi:hypothetical protein
MRPVAAGQDPFFCRSLRLGIHSTSFEPEEKLLKQKSSRFLLEPDTPFGEPRTCWFLVVTDLLLFSINFLQVQAQMVLCVFKG